MKSLYISFTLYCLSAIYNIALSTTEKYRLTYNGDPATTMVIGWHQNGGSGATVYYDIVDHGTSWSSYTFNHGIDRSTSRKGMDHKFARLTGLAPNTVYYFVVKDSDGTSARYSFKTLSNDPNIPLSIIAGGDSRTNPGARRNANKLVAKLRPDFVYFGGDYTDLNQNGEWQDWFDDWQLTTSTDGRMYPIVAARGNHEWSNNDVYEMFDTPNADVYFAQTFGGGLVRAYTLNTEMAIPGSQSTWLQNDLAANQHTVEWKIAQYHKPMRPHVSSKSEGNDQYNNWAQAFYDYGVRLVIECDAHTVKSTWKVKPSTSAISQEGFERDDIFGTVYVGEGCWGAPLRSANDNKNWTRNSGVFNSFQWIKITKQRITVKYIGTDNADSVGTVVDTARFNEPNNLDVWNPSNGSEIIIENEKYTGRPFVDITAPSNGAGYATPQATTIFANANDTNGTIQQVEFFVNDISIGTDATAPYSINWTMPANGSYVLTAWATDNDGYHNISDNVTIFVGDIDITASIATSSDDAEEDISDGNMGLSSSDLEMITEDNSWPIPNDDQIVGLRFTNLNLPQGANIISSYIQFHADEDNSGTSSLTIKGQLSPDPTTFTSTDYDISSRPKTTASVNWSPNGWTSGDQSTDQQTPSLNAIITELVNQPSWQVGNPMAFIIEGTGTRVATSYDGIDIFAPTLHLKFNVNGSASVKDIELPIPNIAIYPNPFVRDVTIDWVKQEKEVDIKVFNSQGKLILNKAVQNTSKTFISLNEDLPKGHYYIKVASNLFEVTKKVVKL